MVAEGATLPRSISSAARPGRAPVSRHVLQGRRDGYRDACGGAPEALARIPVDPLVGIDQAKADEIVAAAGFSGADAAEIARVLQLLGTVYQQEDATLVEVNPLVKTGDGKIIALDAKVSLDENAEFRHPDHAALADTSAENPLEAAAKAKGLNYVKLDGSVGIIGNGAGLVMSTLDVVAYACEEFPGSPKPANFLDIGGGASAEIMASGLEIIIGDEQVKSVFVNVFGGITACDAVANGIVHAFELLARHGEHVDVPLVVRLTATTPSWVVRSCRPQSAGTGTSGHDGRCGPPGRRAGGELKGGQDHGNLSEFRLQMIVQGMTGSEGRKHTHRMLTSGTQVVGGVTPAKADRSSSSNGAAYRSSIRWGCDGRHRGQRHGDLRASQVHLGSGR